MPGSNTGCTRTRVPFSRCRSCFTGTGPIPSTRLTPRPVRTARSLTWMNKVDEGSSFFRSIEANSARRPAGTPASRSEAA